MPILSEYLGPFVQRNQSQWLVSTFTTVAVGMYWSRLLANANYYSWGPDKDITIVSPGNFDRTEVYYHVEDVIVSTKQITNTSWLLYLILAILPALTTAAYLAARFFYQTSIDNGFGISALLAGVRPKTLKLLWGASLSGRVSKSIPVRILVDDPITTIGKTAPPHIKYVLGSEEANDELSHALRYRWPGLTKRWRFFFWIQNRLGTQGTDYKMV